MAERRMFSKLIINSARFLRMPASSRLLYYDLGMEADDDGCVEAFGVMRKTGAAEDDLRVLASKGFIKILNEDLVSYITDWGTNNQIRRDRYHPGIHKNLLESACPVLFPEVSPADGNQMTTNCQPNDNQMETEVRLGKVSIGKVSIDQSSIADSEEPAAPQPKPKPVRHKHGRYSNVLLSDDDLTKLRTEFPADYQDRIERLSEYMESTGKKYKSHLATIRAWARKEKPDPKAPQPTGNVFARIAKGELE